jgi:hypothetical protein
MPQRQHISKPQPGAVGHKDVGREQDLPRAPLGPSREGRGVIQQPPQFLMAPRPGQRQLAFDTPESACTIVHYEAEAEGVPAKCGQHPAMVGHGLRSEGMESLGQVSVDVGGLEVTHIPRQTAAQHRQLLRVSRARPYPVRIIKGEVVELHDTVSLGYNKLPSDGGLSSTPRATQSAQSTPSSIVYGTHWGALAWVASADFRILRTAFRSLLFAGHVMTLLVVGQLVFRTDAGSGRKP